MYSSNLLYFSYSNIFQVWDVFLNTFRVRVRVAHLNFVLETRLAVSRIITWTTEPKSVDVRKVWRYLIRWLLMLLLLLLRMPARRRTVIVVIIIIVVVIVIVIIVVVVVVVVVQDACKEVYLTCNSSVRLQESAAVIVALFELNTPEFSMMLTVLPKSFQVRVRHALLVSRNLQTKIQTNHAGGNQYLWYPVPRYQTVSLV